MIRSRTPWSTAVLAAVWSLAAASFAVPGQLLAASTTAPQEPVDAPAEAPTVVVKAVFFFSPTCPHCHDVMENVLPGVMARYGNQLELVGIDVSSPNGQRLYQSAVSSLGIPEDRLGVPTLVVGEEVMVGSGEIPARFSGLVEAGLAEGGLSWPDIPGLEAAVARAQTAGSAPDSAATASGAPGTDTDAGALPEISGGKPSPPSGAGLAWAVLAGLVLALVYAGIRIVRAGWPPEPDSEGLNTGHGRWAVPLLVAAGTGVASYLAVVEMTSAAAVCGPVGDCNRVQSSSYATLAGVPVAVLGLGAYLALGVAWGALRGAGARGGLTAYRVFVGFAAVGTLFSVYLTALELFVIHAVCLWCLSSAMITALLLVQGASLASISGTASTPTRHSGREATASAG